MNNTTIPHTTSVVVCVHHAAGAKTHVRVGCFNWESFFKPRFLFFSLFSRRFEFLQSTASTSTTASNCCSCQLQEAGNSSAKTHAGENPAWRTYAAS